MTALPLHDTLRLAHEHHTSGRLDIAATLYRDVLRAQPQQNYARHMLGVLAAQSGDYDEAITLLEPLLAEENSPPLRHNLTYALLRRGEMWGDAGRLSEASACFSRLLTLTPDLPEGLWQHARTLHALGQEDAAITALYRLLHSEPENLQALTMLGGLLVQRDREPEAVVCLRSLIVLTPAEPLIWWNLSVLHTRTRDAAAARHSLWCTLRLDPAHTNALWALGLDAQYNGNLKLAVACYQSLLTLDPALAPALLNLGAALRSLGQNDRAQTHLLWATALRDDLAEADYNLGELYFLQGAYNKAAGYFRRYLQACPQHGVAHFRLGLSLCHLDRPAEAEPCFRTAVILSPGDGDAHSNLGIALRHQERFAEAVISYGYAQRIDPSQASYFYNQGLSLVTLARFEEAEAVFRSTLNLEPRHVGAHHLLARARLQKGDLVEGTAEYEWRPNNLAFLQERQGESCIPLWDGQPAPDGTIILGAEGGIGDVLQFFRYAPLVAKRCAQVALTYSSNLHHLLRTLPPPARGQPYLHNPLQAQNVRGSAMCLSLPYIMGTVLETIPASVPYLHADPELTDCWRRLLRHVPGLRVGLAWETRGDRERSVPVGDLLRALADIPGISLFALQKGLGAEELAELPATERARVRIYPIDEGPDVFADTAALMTVLDLVISIDTAAAHLAGALGVPTWVLLCASPDWRWLLDRDDSPWYPSMRLFRQTDMGDWTPVLQALAERLARVAAGTEAADRRLPPPTSRPAPNTPAECA